jgi:small-conductance mechanosensitive channel
MFFTWKKDCLKPEAAFADNPDSTSRLLMRKGCEAFVLVCFIVLFGLTATGRTANSDSEVVSLEGVAPSEVNTILAGLSDEQVRALLIEEIKRDPSFREEQETERKGFVSLIAALLHILEGDGDVRIGDFVAMETRMVRSLPADLDWMFRSFSGNSSRSGSWHTLGILLLVFGGAFVVEMFFRLMTGSIRKRFKEQVVPDIKGIMRFWAALLRVLPTVFYIVVFAVASILIFVWTPLESMQSLRYLFVALLFVIIAIRMTAVLSGLFFSPGIPELRLAPVTDQAASRIHGAVLFLVSYTVIGLSFLALAREIGMQEGSLSLIAMMLATILLLLIGSVVLVNHKYVSRAILADVEEDSEQHWVLRMFASIWHVLVLGYLLIVWFFMIFQEMLGGDEHGGAFLFSLLLLPAFVVLDRIGLWVVRSIIETMRIYDPASLPDDEHLQEALADMERRKKRMILRVQNIVRLFILAALWAWGLSVWGYPLPYAAVITKAVFDSLVTLSLALLFWRFASSYIERKIQESLPEEEENAEEDDEWGAAANRGRSYTLLPMVRKFIGTTLVVMVTLIILSSLGVDIGPLLAGAGVIGLAIGFGAQKLVADVFSGFFYLLDDAFRVGEYMEAGGVSGAVEAITLRNVMLRHHRGMLQIVPYSELGAITNYMRGGIVVKFNLEFPYDTDIDKVRKIIKKVGQAMLKDPEFGDDFIRPVKSQGVREITSSVMVIRVKFTAKPGTHFVIRREAYRRITEALAAKGIHYAHRKVIVELPEDVKQQAESNPKMLKEAAAGAAMSVVEEQEEKKTAGRNGEGGSSGMPGM